jgi:hypothetical protein
MICLGCSAFAQKTKDSQKAKEAQDAKDAQIQKALKDAADKGIAVPVNLSVNENVRAQAVLIPFKDAKRIFGREIASNYAVIQLVVGNKSNDASLIIHGIFIDYRYWPLSGSDALSFDANDRVIRSRDKPFQTATNPHQIASEEYRVVRGQLLEAQNWTWRTLSLRLLTFAGGFAGATGYAFNARDNKFIAAFNGNVPSGFATLFPDPTLEQLKHVDDFGYHANKLVPQHDSEIIICFFPIDRFLTPGFRRLYLKSPALFFAPLLMLADTKIQPDVTAVLGARFGTISLSDLKDVLPCYMSVKKYLSEPAGTVKTLSQSETDQTKPNGSSSDQTKPSDKNQPAASLLPNMDEYAYEDCLTTFGFHKSKDGPFTLDTSDATSMKAFKLFEILDYIGEMSLNKVTVVVDGVMAVDTSGITPKIDGVDFDPVANCGDDHMPCFWTDTSVDSGVRKGKVRGSYLTGGQIKVQEAEDLKITGIKTISEGSSDQVVYFSFKLTQAIADQKQLHFIVSKPAGAKDSKAIDSLPFEYIVTFGQNLKGPKISKVELDKNENTLTITGKELIDAPPTNALVVTLHTPGDEDVDVKPKSPPNGTKLVIDIPADKKVPGCWSVKVKIGEKVAPDAESDLITFAITPSPKLTKATLNKDDTVTVEGADLVDIKDCGGKKLSFHFSQDTTALVHDETLSDASSHSPTKWTLKKPTKVGRGKWHVKVQVDGKDVPGSSPVELQ